MGCMDDILGVRPSRRHRHRMIRSLGGGPKGSAASPITALGLFLAVRIAAGVARRQLPRVRRGLQSPDGRATREAAMRVERVFTRRVMATTRSTPLAEAAAAMRRYGVGSLLVMEDGGRSAHPV